MKYGEHPLRLRVREALHGGHWNLERAAARASEEQDRADLSTALDELRAAGLPAAVEGRRLGLLLADGTREWDPDALLLPLAPLVRSAAAIDALLCTGTHDPRSPENRAMAARVAAALAEAGLAGEVRVADCRNDEYRRLGTTSRGTPIDVHEALLRAEVTLALADMKPHYFAGYSNPVKYYVPGLASAETARANHSLALEAGAEAGRHPWHPEPANRQNPLAADMVEAFDLITRDSPSFALVLSTAGARVLWAAGGTTAAAAARGMAAVDRRSAVDQAPARFAVISPGGSPHDESLYTAQRAVELSNAAVEDGGEVLFLARCPNGIGPPGARENFFEPLARPLEEVRAPARQDYVLYGHKPVKLARILRRLGALWILSELEGAAVERVHMRPAAAAQAVLDRWERIARPADRVVFIDDASKLVVRAAGAGQVPMP